MANLFRAYPTNVAGKSGLLPVDKTATLNQPIAVTLTGVGKNLDHVTLNAPITLTLTSAAEAPLKATVNRPITLTLTSAVDVVRIGTVDKPIPITLTAAARHDITATLDKSIALTLASDVRITIYGQASNTLNFLNNVVLAGQGNVQPTKALFDEPLVLTLAASAYVQNAKLNAPIALTLVSATTQLSALNAVTTLPSFTGDAVLASVSPNSVTLPAFTGNAVLAGANTYDASATMPAFIGSSDTGHSSKTTLPAITGSAQLDSGKIATVIVALPALTSDAVLVPDDSAYSDTTLPLLTGSSTVVSISSASALQILPSVVGDAVLLAGLELTSDTSLPAITGSATLVNGQILVSVLTLPALTTNAVMDNGVTLVTATYVFNTENMAATEYSNYDFIAMGMFNGVPVGIGNAGVFELTGTDDDGTNIDVDVLSGFDDLGTEDLKRMPNAYLGYKSDGAVQFQVSIDGEPTVRTYNVTKVSNTSGIKRGRVKVAKGLKSRYWQVGVKNVAGSDIELEDLGLYTQQFKRKVQ